MIQSNFSAMNSIQELQLIKEQLKNQVICEITWQERVELYKHIQMIKLRIQELIKES